jgi:hypothetical protein
MAPISEASTASSYASPSACSNVQLASAGLDDLLLDGSLFTALILSTSFSEKYQGRHMQPGATAAIRIPSASLPQTRSLRLLGRTGHREAVAFTWLGDEAAGDQTLYVAFAPMRRKRQFFKIIGTGANLVSEDLGSWSSCDSPVKASTSSIQMSSYIQRKLRKVWTEYGLQQQLSEFSQKYPHHRVMFSGISHGATLAQVAALQFRFACPDANVHVVTWNAFKWTDADGSALVEQAFGPRLTSFVLAREGRWDSVAGFPRGLAPMQRLLLLDADDGSLSWREASATFPGNSSPFDPVAWSRAFELHFAPAAIKATRLAMSRALVKPINVEDALNLKLDEEDITEFSDAFITASKGDFNVFAARESAFGGSK